MMNSYERSNHIFFRNFLSSEKDSKPRQFVASLDLIHDSAADYIIQQTYRYGLKVRTEITMA